jgi:predicted permease
MSAIVNEIRYALRKLGKSPGFTAVALLTLALGIGLNSAVFSLVNAVLFRPMAVDEPDQLVRIYSWQPGDFTEHMPMSFPDLLDLRERCQSFQQMIGFSFSFLALETEDQNQLIVGEMVTGNYFEMLGVPALLGRTFTAADDQPGSAEKVVVLSHAAFKSRFGADTGVVGRQLRINGYSFDIIGVASPEFNGLTPGVTPELWFPIANSTVIRALPTTSAGSPTPGLNRIEDRDHRWHWVMGRLQPEVSPAQAAAELSTVVSGLQQEFPDTNADRGMMLLPASQVRIIPAVDSSLQSGSWIVMGIVALVLLIASANLANMLLARALSRRQEIATRLAVGASRGLLIRQLVIESLVLALLGGGLGLLLALATNQVFNSLSLPLPIQLSLGLSLDTRVVLFTLAISSIAAVAFGLAPAFDATRTDLATALHGEARLISGSRQRQRMRSMLVVAQVALALLLLVSTGLSLRSLQKASQIDPGFNPNGVAVARFAPGLQGYDRARSKEFFDRLMARVQALPGVDSASFVSHAPATVLEFYGELVVPDGKESAPVGEWHRIDAATAGPGYFETLQIPVLEGRTFSDWDQESQRLTVVNQTLAELFWPNESAVGKKIHIDRVGRVFEVVGVVGNGKYRTLGEKPRPFLYTGLSQHGLDALMLMVRTSGQVEAPLTAIRESARAIDDKMAISELCTLIEKMSPSMMLPRVGATLFGVFGFIGLLIATTGIYGVMAYAVSQRTHEIGVRVAMGASPSDILRLVIPDGLRLTAFGLGLGLALAAVATRILEALLYGVSSTDLMTFTAVPLVIALVALVACYVPARRAISVNPVVALRSE